MDVLKCLHILLNHIESIPINIIYYVCILRFFYISTKDKEY